jgi:hypothetical protein
MLREEYGRKSEIWARGHKASGDEKQIRHRSGRKMSLRTLKEIVYDEFRTLASKGSV